MNSSSTPTTDPVTSEPPMGGEQVVSERPGMGGVKGKRRPGLELLMVGAVAAAVVSGYTLMSDSGLFTSSPAGLETSPPRQAVQPGLKFSTLRLEQTAPPISPHDPSGPPELRYSFPFTNTSANPVKITKVLTSCACAVSAPTATEIAPGASAAINVRLNATAIGTSEQQVTVMASDGNPPTTLRLVYHYHPPADVQVSPARVRLGAEPVYVTLTINSTAQPIPTVSDLADETGAIMAEVVKDEPSTLRTTGGRFPRWVTLRLARRPSSPPIPAQVSPVTVTVSFDAQELPPVKIEVELQPGR